MADQGAEGLLSPLLRRQRFRRVLPHVNGRILDYGCGTGRLAEHIPQERYHGVEPDALSLRLAQTVFPHHRFSSSADEKDRFETVVALAVIEHVDDPAGFLRQLTAYLGDAPDARIIVTTPHPSVRRAYSVGAALGLFSRHACDEHARLLDRSTMIEAGRQAALRLVRYERFLLRANQLFVFEKAQ